MSSGTHRAEPTERKKLTNKAMILIGVAILSFWVGLLLSGGHMPTSVVVLGALFLAAGLLAHVTRKLRGNPDER